MNKTVQPATIRKVVQYLQDLGLKVYGSAFYPESNATGPGCMDYDADLILKYRKAIQKLGRLERLCNRCDGDGRIPAAEGTRPCPVCKGDGLEPRK